MNLLFVITVYLLQLAIALDCKLKSSWQSPITDADLKGASSYIIDFQFHGSECNDSEIFGGSLPDIIYSINTYSMNDTTTANIDQFVRVDYPQIFVDVDDAELAGLIWIAVLTG